MKNIRTHKEFVNEEWFGRGNKQKEPSKYQDFLDKLEKIINNRDIDTIRAFWDEGNVYSLNIRRSKPTPEDPYGEEEREDDILITIKKLNNHYYLKINDDSLGIEDELIKKLWDLISYKKANKKEIEKQNRISTSIKKIVQFEDEEY
jgi:hypothetical protein